jgi:murein L,D-transpeptidase YcbB/YkuD
VRNIPYRDRLSYLVNFAKSNPHRFFRALPPRTNEYARLMKEKMRLERLLASGGWGPRVPGGALKPGATGSAVVALRNRLIAMGFMGRSATQSYDADIQSAVQQFQLAHGLATDGVAGASTLEELNTPVEDRLKSVLVAMERERWLNQPRGSRHVLVNITDFSARIIDNDTVTFETRSVVGATASDRRTPEFSDVMEHMVINPTWHVPRSIAVKEYLPMLKRNRNAVSHLRLVDARGRTVSRSAVNFSNYTARTFPFNIKQPPSRRNALGLVKFMFPNKHNIYLHDTPAKNLFSREVRAYSHGCIRLHEPFDFAYTLLARQTDDPKGFFQAKLATGTETVVPLDQPVPVHLIYRTAFTRAKGHMQYRRDIYDRDARIWTALSRAGVVLRAVQG